MQWIKFYPISLFLLMAFAASAQHDSFENARALSANTTLTASVCASENYYFKTLLPSNGTLAVTIKGKNMGTAAGYVYAYIYDGRQATGQKLAAYVGSSYVAAGASTEATLRVYGQLSDDAYIRITTSGCFDLSISYTMENVPPTDPEPNDEVAAAVSLPYNTEARGNVQYEKKAVRDASDYYKIEFPANGTLSILVNGVNRSNSAGYLYAYVYDDRGMTGQVYAGFMQGSNIASGTEISDTIVLKGRQKGTYYLRMTAGVPFAYGVRYLLEDAVPQETEPNDAFNVAIATGAGEEKSGNIGYVLNSSRDETDYYAMKLPEYGTLRIRVTATNMSASSGYLYHYGYNKGTSLSQVFARYIKSSNVAAGETIQDTVLVDCQAADSFYHRFTSSGSWKYSWSYDMINTSPHEAAPNNSFETATELPYGFGKKDNIGYNARGVVDTEDYFLTSIPNRDTLRFIINGTNHGSANGWLYIYVYEKRATGAPVQVAARYLFGSSNLTPNVARTDTVVINVPAADAYYLRFTNSGCWSYTIRPYDKTLPVKFTHFNGRAEKGYNTLDWGTASEINNRGFEIEAGTDGKDFSKIGFVASRSAAGNSSTVLNYSFNHKQPEPVQYYRLYQIDLDGSKAYSKTIRVENSSSELIVVAPNPASAYFQIRASTTPKQVKLIDVQGRVVREFGPTSGGRYDLSGLVSGIYVVHIQLAHTIHTKKISIIH